MNIHNPPDLRADPGAIAAFLEAFRPGGPWLLNAKGESSGMRGELFTDAGAAARWAAERNAQGWNVWFSVNPVAEVPKSGKAAKGDITGAEWLHVDVDPRTGEDLLVERARIAALIDAEEPAPTLVLDSGNGMWALWRLDAPACTDDAEDRNRALEVRFGADACHNIDRIARLPGTVNWPDRRKRARGRGPVWARVVRHDPGLTYPLSAFAPAPPVGRSPAVSADRLAPAHPLAGARGEVQTPPDLPRTESLDDLPEGVSQRTKMLIVQGCDPDEPGRYASRSEAMFAVACDLVRAGVSDEVAAGIISDPDWAISAHVLDQPRPHLYAARQVERARDAVESDFICNDAGKPVKDNQHNVRLALAKLGASLSYDAFRDRALVEGVPGMGPLLDDAAVDRLWLTIDEAFGFRPSKDFFWTVVPDLARRAPFHPVRDYLDSLSWDGTRRLDRWLVTYGGAEDSEYARAVGALMLVAAVRRVRQPGAKFDEMLVLEGAQGTNKSSALAVLAVEDDWFSDDLPLNADPARTLEALRGHWIIEAAELAGMRRADVERVKAQTSRRTDRARLAWGRTVSEVPRQCVFFGTTNDDRYLRDATGNRRFWPVRIERFDLDALRRDRDQLWAEAAAREAAGADIRLPPALWAAAGDEQEARRIEDPWVAVLGDALGDLEGKIHNADAWEVVGVPAERRTQEHNVRLGNAMRELGWERTKRRFGGKYAWGWVRGGDPRRVGVMRRDDGSLWVGHAADREAF